MTWEPNYTITPQIVVCAANRHPNGTIVLGARHYDGLMRESHRHKGRCLTAYPGKTISDRSIEFHNEIWNESEQGFMINLESF